MPRANFDELLESGVHFGHLKRKWNPHMAPYIFGEKKGIHIIDLNKTIVKLDDATNALKQIAKSGKKILFVATKKQAKDTVSELAKKAGMPHVTERWSGGMLTNFATIRKSIRKMNQIDKMKEDGTFATLSKRERLFKDRTRAKLDKNLGSIADMTRTPAAIFIVDIMREHIALAEAKKLGIPVFAMVDTNSDPRKVDFAIPSNDDASQSISVILGKVMDGVIEGLSERKKDKDSKASAKAESKKEAPKAEKVEAPKKEEAPKEEAPVAAAPVVEAPAKEEAPAPAKAKKADAKPDDLKKIEGIGPKIATTLNEAGVNSYADLAKLESAKISEIIAEVRGNHVTDTWPKQAGMAAEGKAKTPCMVSQQAK